MAFFDDHIVAHRCRSVGAVHPINFMRMLAMPKMAAPWSLTSLREKLIKIGAEVVSHGRYVNFQLAEVAVPRQIFAEILLLIARLRAPPAPA
ncbi:MAG TPA: transposase [Burkholderiaceae bacterium]|nr:transposase [Burkholderiaceae bacterium]